MIWAVLYTEGLSRADCTLLFYALPEERLETAQVRVQSMPSPTGGMEYEGSLDGDTKGFEMQIMGKRLKDPQSGIAWWYL